MLRFVLASHGKMAEGMRDSIHLILGKSVGFDPEFPPFGFKNELNEYDGFDLALAKEVCERLGWEFTPQPID